MAYCADTTCSILLNSRCVFYEGAALPNTGINTNDSLQTALEKIDEAISSGGGGGSAVWGDITGTIGNQSDLISLLGNYTLETRILTINGTSFDLSVDRTWNVGVVTSLTAGSGISIGGTSAVPIITNTAPDQTVVLNNGTGITVSGTYPNFTITNTSPSLGGDMILASAQTSTGKKSFTSDGTTAGLRLLPFAGTPSTMQVGEVIFNSTEDAYVGRTSTAGNIAFLYCTLGAFITNAVPFMVGNSLDGAIGMSSSLTFNGTTFAAPDISASRLILSTGGTDAHLNVGSIAGDATTNLANAQIWYNSSTNTFRGRLNAANVSFFTTASTVGVVNGGTGLTTIAARSIWVANATDTITTVTPAAGQSIRINAGNTAWEAYTPGSGGISNTAINTELMKSDGTNAVPSGIFIPSNGSIDLGSASISGGRTIQVLSSTATANLNIYSKSSGLINFGHSGTTTLILASSSRSLGFNGGASFIEGAGNGAGAGYDLTILSGVGTGASAGNLYLTGGNGTTIGNVVLGSGGGGSITNFQGMERGVALFNVAVEPSAAITDSVAIYSTDNAASSLLGIRCETAVQAEVAPTITHSLLMKLNGTIYKVALITP